MTTIVNTLEQYAAATFRMTQTVIVKDGKERTYTAWNVVARKMKDGRIKVLVTWSVDKLEEGEIGLPIMRPFFLPAGWCPPTMVCSAGDVR